MSQCRSFDSNCHPCSQSRKISIGILVDSSANIRHRSRKQDDTKVPTVEKVPSKVNSVDDGNDGEGIKAVVKGKQIEIPEHESSPWVSTRLFLQKPTTSKAVRYDLKANDGMSNRSSEVKAAPRTHSVQFSANHMAVLQSGDGKQKKIERVSYKREGSKDGTKARVEEFSFATAQENFVPEKEMVEERTNRTEDRREALRMKLWDILGTVSSPNKQVSQNPEVGMNNLNLEQIIDRQSKPIVKSRQNSDTIKPDSESPDQSIRRPVTRSLTRKRVPGKVQTKKTKNAPSSTYTSKHPEKNIFSFEEGFSGRLDAAVTGASPKAFRKKRERKGFKAEAHGTCFPEKDNPDFIQQATDLSKRTKCAQKTSLGGNIKGTFHIYPPKNNSEFAKLENRTRKKDSVQLSAMKITDEQSNLHTYTAPKLKDQQEVLANSFRKNIVDPRFDLQSPTFELGTPNKSCSPGSLPKTNHGEVDDQSPAHCIFTSLLPSRPDHHKANIGTVSSDNAEELEDSPLTKSEPDMEENDAENGLSKSSSEERDSKSSKEGSPIREGYKDTEVFTHGQISLVCVNQYFYEALNGFTNKYDASVPF